MKDQFVREVFKAFAKLGPVEYRMTKDYVDIYKDNKMIGRVKDNYLYLVNKEEKLVQVTQVSRKLGSNLNDKMIIAYNSSNKIVNP